MSPSTHFDLIIIGTGLGGGMLAYKLAPSENGISQFVSREDVAIRGGAVDAVSQ